MTSITLPSSGRRMMRAMLLAGAAAALLAGAAQAQVHLKETWTIEGANGHFLTSIQNSGAAYGFTEAQTAKLRLQGAKAIELLKAVPSVSSPPPPACSLIRTRENNTLHPGGVVASDIAVTTPVLGEDGKCGGPPIIHLTEMSTTIYLNLPVGLPTKSPVDDGVDDDWRFLQILDRRPGYLELPNAVYFHESRAELIKPISVERYARDQLRMLTDGGRHDGGPLAAEWEGRLANWSPEERAGDACLEADLMMAKPDNDCRDDRKAWEFNTAFFDSTRPSDVQMIAFDFPGLLNDESAASWSVREPIPRLLDRGALASLIARP